MNVLAFDTSSYVCSVALYKSGIEAAPNESSRIYMEHRTEPMQQGRLILPLIDSLLNEANLTIHDLSVIAYGRGPGSLTGARLACSVAQGLSYATKSHLVGISTLAAMAQTAHMENKYTNLWVALDARMNQIYWACYQANQDGFVELVGKEEMCLPTAITCPPIGDHREGVGIGDGWVRYVPELNGILGKQVTMINTMQQPLAHAILTLANTEIQRENWTSINDAIPVYLR